MNIEWNPQKETIRAINSSNTIKAFKIFRSTSSAYIKKSDIRKHIFKDGNSICYVCEKNIANQIDHVKSVYQCFKEKEFYFCNSIENLKPICSKCNQIKKP